jgi:poly-beta-1,6-N-acetyl-D-glucosamine synthase
VDRLERSQGPASLSRADDLLKSMTHGSYVLISACRNEAEYVDGLIDCIAAQTVAPFRWVLIDDGSTDSTYEKAVARTEAFPSLQVVRMPGGRPRSFSSQVYAANHGCELVRELNYDFIGFLDADIRVKADYYERLMNFFHRAEKLGLAGGAVIDQYPQHTEYIRKGSENSHVPGGVQFFRRQCFEQIGAAYTPIDGGGQDTIADVMVLMRGWQLQVFPELEAMHLRPDGFSKDNPLQRGMKWGRKFYLLGYDPVAYAAQCIRRLTRRPFIIGSCFQLLGYLFAIAKNEHRPVSTEFVAFHRKLLRRRMAGIIRGAFGGDLPETK